VFLHLTSVGPSSSDSTSHVCTCDLRLIINTLLSRAREGKLDNTRERDKVNRLLGSFFLGILDNHIQLPSFCDLNKQNLFGLLNKELQPGQAS
jgi:hypothetical protein